MSLFRIFIIVFCAFLMTSWGQSAFATGSGAYNIEVPDAGAMGMGSAFVGEADTPAAMYYNPAGMNQMTRPEISVGDALIAPRGHMVQPNGNTVHMQNNEFNIPNFYAVLPVNNKLSIGFGSGSYWGTATNWGPNSPLEYATTQASITDIDNSLAFSYQVTPQWSIAASVDNDESKADESFALNGYGGSIGIAELKGGDDAWGYRIATLYKINDKNQIGLIYRSRINHNYRGKMSINGANPTAYGFSSYVSNVSEKSVLPQSVVAGYSFKPTKKWTVNLDVAWVDWSSTKYQTININGSATLNTLGFAAPTPADWHSAWSESIGTQYNVNDRFRVRLGYYHHEMVIPDATFNPRIPDSNSNGYTTGFGYDITKRLTLDVAYSILFYDTRNIINSVAKSTAGSAGTVDGKYSEFINIGLVSLTYKF
ncbi:MAG: outer membrane protein transport protein [Candidatus Omnitrophica bacterium]|nr:outer membrane protein transport protein [Candidatus Omnitrophota bacterium]MDE2213665.1 outer membrane protein transport protein [Candidatus Omnitrophota bacterium]